MIDFDQRFFYNLRDLAGKNLSQAHLQQHFTSAKYYLNQAGLSREGTGAWSAYKIFDTAVCENNHLTGTKHWISGASLCDWAVATVIQNQKQYVVLFDTKQARVRPIPTMGMEDTLTSHVDFDQTPCTILYERGDARCWPVDSYLNLGFLTIQLGLMQALLQDIDNYTAGNFDYEKKKLKLDVEMMKLAWQQEVQQVNESYKDQPSFWSQRQLIYAFGKKTLCQVTNFVTEVTGSGLYEPGQAGHQRYKDALIYCTHMRNVSAAVNMCFGQK